jgi:hypothetical protein
MITTGIMLERAWRWLKDAAVGTLAGAMAGGALGWVLAWDKVFLGGDFLTFWRACGPHLFIPLWMGTVIGFASRIDRDSILGYLLTAIAGMAAGVLAPTAYGRMFGTPYPASGFTATPHVLPLLLLLCGGVAAVGWRATFDKLID